MILIHSICKFLLCDESEDGDSRKKCTREGYFIQLDTTKKFDFQVSYVALITKRKKRATFRQRSIMKNKSQSQLEQIKSKKFMR